MILDHIIDKNGNEVGPIVDGSQESADKITISAENVNPCGLDLRFVSRQFKECGGVYLLWRNGLGWSDHLFFKAYERKLNVKSRGEIQRHYLNRATAREATASRGFEVAEEWDLENRIPYDNEAHRRDLETLLYSREVLLYTGQQYSGDVKFLGVKVKPERYAALEKAIKYNEFTITIQLPNVSTLKL